MSKTITIIEDGAPKEVSITRSSSDVHQPCPEWTSMEELRVTPRTLMGGTKAMRAAGKTYLPKKPAESEDTYTARLHASVLFNAFKKAVEQLTGKVFSKPVSIKDGDERVKEWWENVDQQGNSGDIFSRDVFRMGITEGMSFILVDYPHVPDEEMPTNMAEQMESGARPYFVHIKPQQVIGWKSEDSGGAVVLTQVRIMETVSVPTDGFLNAELQQVRVLEPGLWQLWRQDEKNPDLWLLYDEGTTSLDYIPLVPFYTNRTGFMTAEPPLQDLADLNVKHWQSSSAQDHITDYVRFPLLFAKCLGLQAGENIVIGPSNLIKSESPDADLRHVEHTGAAIAAGRTALKDIEAQMAFMALEPMLQQASGDITATKTAVDSSSAASQLMAWAVAYKDAMELALEYMADYVGLDNPGEVQMDFDFVLSLASTDGLLLLQSFQAKAISRQTYVMELMRRGTLSDDIDLEKDAQLIDEESAASLEAMATAMRNQGMGLDVPPGRPKPGEERDGQGGGGQPPFGQGNE